MSTDRFFQKTDNVDKKKQELTHTRLFTDFRQSLSAWARHGASPKAADPDLRYYLDLQHQRLRSRNLELDLDYAAEEDTPIVSYASVLKAIPLLKLSRGMAFHESSYSQNVKVNTVLSRSNKVIYKKSRKTNLYQTIIDPDRADPSLGAMPHTCPNCGGISTIADLELGCPYCSSHFAIADLFPRVFNFYTISQPTSLVEEKKLYKWILLGPALVLLLGLIISGLVRGMDLSEFLFAFFTLLLYVPFFAFLLLVLFGILFFIVDVIYNVNVSVQRSRFRGSNKKINEKLRQLDPNFTESYFVGKVLSLLKTILYHPDPQRASQFVGQDLPPWAKELIDIQYLDLFKISDYRLADNRIYLSLEMPLRLLIDQGQKVKSQRKTLKIDLFHSAQAPVNPGFSIKVFACKSCGASFDASREKFCPHCQSEYDLSEEDWLVTSIQEL